ncbi:hypothetical protein HDU99_002821, partial [Rhizoclosmatium hyalinum]
NTNTFQREDEAIPNVDHACNQLGAEAPYMVIILATDAGPNENRNPIAIKLARTRSFRVASSRKFFAVTAFTESVLITVFSEMFNDVDKGSKEPSLSGAAIAVSIPSA